MNIVDCSKLNAVKARLRKARTITEVARLLNEGRPLEAEIQQSLAEVQRLAHGWTYMPPPLLA